MSKYDNVPPPTIFFHCMPKVDACEHDWTGWRNLENGGEMFCKKCGMGAMHHSIAYDDGE